MAGPLLTGAVGVPAPPALRASLVSPAGSLPSSSCAIDETKQSSHPAMSSSSRPASPGATALTGAVTCAPLRFAAFQPSASRFWRNRFCLRRFPHTNRKVRVLLWTPWRPVLFRTPLRKAGTRHPSAVSGDRTRNTTDLVCPALVSFVNAQLTQTRRAGSETAEVASGRRRRR